MKTYSKGTALVVGSLLAFGSHVACAQSEPDFVPVTNEMLRDPDPADWLMWRRTFDGWGHSPLDQITDDNVAELRLIWTRGMGQGVQEATPLVYDGVMYLPNAGDYIQTMDAATGDLIWEYRRELPEGVQGGTNRTIAIWGSSIINGSSDNQIYAVDAETGELRWETPVVGPTLRARASSGPIVADGKVITGRQCQPDATHESCVVTAHDAETGRELWRFRTIPRPGEPGDETWGDVPLEERWHVGTWMVPSYDPASGLVLVGTSVTIPAPKFLLGGNDNQHLYHNSTLAIDVETGQLEWYYQHVVDHWDLDHPFERLLVDTAVAPDPEEVPWINPRVQPGERREVVTGIPGKTGIVYTLDRRTGEFLWARPTIRQNVVSSIDASGNVTVNPDTLFIEAGQERFICPAAAGGRNWPAGSYSPRTNAMYVPMQNTCMRAVTRTGTRDPSLVYGLSMPAEIAEGESGDLGTVFAVSAETGATLWTYEQRVGVMSLVSTAGGLIFVGDANGRFRALDDATGEVLWETNLGGPVSGYPISYAVDGRQYVAVSTGPSLLANSAARLVPETRPGTGANVFVFALP